MLCLSCGHRCRLHVKTVRELGRLRETLRISPRLAGYIRSFVLLWDMGGDCDEHSFWCVPYGKEEGSMLDMAFRDQVQLWESVRDRYKCQVNDEGFVEYRDNYYFEHNNKRYSAPGRCPEVQYSSWYSALDHTAARYSGDGPDGNGEDPLIKNPDHFLDCCAEIVSQLTSLESFGWQTAVTPLPVGVFKALLKMQRLQALTLTFSVFRGNVLTCE